VVEGWNRSCHVDSNHRFFDEVRKLAVSLLLGQSYRAPRAKEAGPQVEKLELEKRNEGLPEV
jgi:hypothetical protein